MRDFIECKYANRDNERDKSKDCFSLISGFKCDCLLNCDFKDGKCHFYKPIGNVQKGNKKYEF